MLDRKPCFGVLVPGACAKTCGQSVRARHQPGFKTFGQSAVSAPFICLKTPLFAFLSLFVPAVPCIFLQLGFSPVPSSFSCNSFDLHFVHFQSLLFPCISPSAPCFTLPACIASSASSGMMLATLGVLSSIRHPPKTLVFGRRVEMLQKSPKPIRKSFAS